MLIYDTQVDMEDLCGLNEELLRHLSSLVVKETPSVDKVSEYFFFPAQSRGTIFAS